MKNQKFDGFFVVFESVDVLVYQLPPKTFVLYGFIIKEKCEQSVA